MTQPLRLSICRPSLQLPRPVLRQCAIDPGRSADGAALIEKVGTVVEVARWQLLTANGVDSSLVTLKLKKPGAVFTLRKHLHQFIEAAL